jgi:putative sterol carrier protein
VAKYEFLSDGWFDELQRLVAEHGADAPAHAQMKMNLVVIETPFENDVEFHMGTEGGKPLMGKGHLDPADLTMTTDYATAKEVFVAGNPQAGMQAFMAGKVKVQGDMTKLMAAQAGGGPGGNEELQTAIKEMTA